MIRKYCLQQQTYIYVPLLLARSYPDGLGPSSAKCAGQVAYRLELPDNMQQVHNVFHVSLIKQYRSDGCTQPPPPPDLVDDCPEWTVEQVLDQRTLHRGRQKKIEYLISWVSHGDEHNTWEPAKNVSNSAELVQDYWLTLPANCTCCHGCHYLPARYLGSRCSTAAAESL